MSCWVTLILIGCLMFFDGGQSTITPKTAYLIRVTTSPQVNAEPATGDQVFIKLSGDRGATAFKELRRVVKSFENGSESEFSIIAMDVGNITEITVNKTATGPKEAWKLKQLTIEDSKGTTYEFTCKCWISKNSGLQRTLKPNKVIPPTSSPTQVQPTTPSSSSSVSSSAPSASVTPTSGNTATPTNKEESTKGIAESTVEISGTSTKPTTSSGTATSPTGSQPSGTASTPSAGSTSLKSTASTSSGPTSNQSSSTSPTSAAPSGSLTSGSTSAKPSGPTSKQTSSSASPSASVSGATSKPTSSTGLTSAKATASTVSKSPTPASKPTASTSPTSVKPSGLSSVKPSGIPSSKPTSSAGPTSKNVTASIGASTAPTSMPTSTAGPTSEASTNSISQPTPITSTGPTSAKPSGPSTSAKPSGPSTSAKPSGPSTSAKPSGPSTSAKTSGPTSSKPSGQTSTKPSGPTSVKPSSPSTSAKPSGSTSAKPSGPPSAEPSGPTSAKPSGSSSAKPSGPSSAKPTTVIPSSQSTAKSSSPASAKPSGSTRAKPTSAKPSGPSSSTSSGLNTAKPSGPTSVKTSGPTTAKPSGPTSAKPSGPSSPTSSGLSTTKPSGPTSGKPSGSSSPTTSGLSPSAASPTPATSGNISSIPTTSTTPAQEHAAFMHDLLHEMNVIRLLHGAGPLLLEKNMSQAAQKEADKLFKRQTVNNETETTYGISTCNLVGSAPGKNKAKHCVSSWYQTVKDFDWPTPKVTAKSAQFARLVWKPTTHVGIGVSGINVVVYFDPPSNEMESAKDNISPVTELSDGTSQECPEGFRMYGKSCFKLNPVPLTWAKAIEECAHHGATLASLQSQEENTFITGMISGLQKTSEAWLGFNDRIVESRYQWVDGSVVRFHQFLRTEPTGIGENCIALKDTKNESGWEDRKCTDVLPSLCRRPAEGPITYKITILIEVGIDVQGASKKTAIPPAGLRDQATLIKEKLNSTSSKQPIEIVGESTEIGLDGGTYYSVFVKIPPGSNPNVVQLLQDYLDNHDNHIQPDSKYKDFIASVTPNDPANGMCYSTCITSCSNHCSPMCCSGSFIINPSSQTQVPPYQRQTQVYNYPNSYSYSSSSSYSHPYLPNYPYSSPSAQQNSLSSTNQYMAPSTMGCARACSKITKNDFCPPYCPKRCCRARLFRPRFFQPRLVIRPRF